MDSSPSSTRAPAPVRAAGADRLRHLPEAAQAGFRAFSASGDVAALDPLIFAILEQYAPRKSAAPVATRPGSTLLMEDLGFDSLSIMEMVFFIEELLDVTIANEELVPIRTLADLRGFVRTKVAARGNP